jgi:ArsR family transcriptional regulator
MNMHSYLCCKNNISETNRVDKISSLLKIIGDPSRLKILCILRQKEHCVCELIEHVKLSQSLISHHLQDLKQEGIVIDEKRGVYVYYSLTEEGRRVTDLVFKI